MLSNSSQPFTEKITENDKVEELINLIHTAHYKKVNPIVKINPSLLFKPTTTMFESMLYGKYYNHHKIANTSPLKLAIKMLDIHLCKIFEKIIEIKQPELLSDFLKLLQEQKYINLQPLFKAYKNYERHYNLWARGRISLEELKKIWLQVGLEQRRRLPLNMLKDFFCIRRGKSIPINLVNLGYDFTLLREGDDKITIENFFPAPEKSNIGLEFFQALYEKRINAFICLQESLQTKLQKMNQLRQRQSCHPER